MSDPPTGFDGWLVTGTALSEMFARLVPQGFDRVIVSDGERYVVAGASDQLVGEVTPEMLFIAVEGLVASMTERFSGDLSRAVWWVECGSVSDV
jgi:hypothetical protein